MRFELTTPTLARHGKGAEASAATPVLDRQSPSNSPETHIAIIDTNSATIWNLRGKRNSTAFAQVIVDHYVTDIAELENEDTDTLVANDHHHR